MTPDQRFEEGFALHRQGRLADAERVYADVLRMAPRHFGALHSLGVIGLQTRQYERAAELLGKSISVDRKYAPAHNNLGYALSLFATAAFAREIEGLYARMHERHANGMRPDHLSAAG